MIVELKMPQSNSKKESNGKNKPQEQGKGKSGGFVELLKNIIKALFNSVVDLPEQYKNYSQHQGKQESVKTSIETTVGQKGKKNPEDLDQEEVKKAAEGLKKRPQKSDAGNQSVEIKVPGQTSIQDIDSSKTMKR